MTRYSFARIAARIGRTARLGLHLLLFLLASVVLVSGCVAAPTEIAPQAGNPVNTGNTAEGTQAASPSDLFALDSPDIDSLSVDSFTAFSSAAAARAHHGPEMLATYELLAKGEVPGLSRMSIAEKKTVIDGVVDRLIEEVGATRSLEIEVGSNGLDRLHFPPVDLDLDGVVDEVGRTIEVSAWTDAWFLRSTELTHAAALPWSLAVYSEGDMLKVVLGVPETFTRLFFRGERTLPGLVATARAVPHRMIRKMVADALTGRDFETGLNKGLPGTEMDEERITAMESVFGPVTPETIAPSVVLPGATVDEVVAAIEAAVVLPRVPDLNGDGATDDGLDEAMMPEMLGRYVAEELSFEEMLGMMEMGFDMWPHGFTFQQWVHARTLDLSSPGTGAIHLIELCQPFYAAVALSSGLHHMPAMPCAVTVWEVDGGVALNVLDPAFIFAYLFADAADTMPPALQKLFGLFPAFVYNEMVTLVNAGLRNLGYQNAYELHPVAAPGEAEHNTAAEQSHDDLDGCPGSDEGQSLDEGENLDEDENLDHGENLGDKASSHDANLTVSGEGGIAIPDDDPVGITSEAVVPPGTVGVLSVSVEISHTWVDDLEIWLSHGSNHWLLDDAPWGGDDRLVEIYSMQPAPTGDLGGTWSLYVRDNFAMDTGVLESWSITVTQQ